MALTRSRRKLLSQLRKAIRMERSHRPYSAKAKTAVLDKIARWAPQNAKPMKSDFWSGVLQLSDPLHRKQGSKPWTKFLHKCLQLMPHEEDRILMTSTPLSGP